TRRTKFFLISSTFDKNRMFITMWSEIEGRFDCNFYKPEYKEIINKIKAQGYYRIKDIIGIVNSSWDQKSIYNDTFPYIEIGGINTETGTITDYRKVNVQDAPSRAKKVVFDNDIIVSGTRPTRGAIVYI